MFRSLLPAALALLSGTVAAQSVFFNEIHYDNVGGDVGEFIEVAGPPGTDLSGWSVVLYNGSAPAAATTYNTTALSGTLPTSCTGLGVTVLNYPANGIQNGGNDGMALVDNMGAVVQFLSYEGVTTASNGPAMGLTSTDIGVSEVGTEPVGQSLQLNGTGSMYANFTWTAPAAQTPGACNTMQMGVGMGMNADLSMALTDSPDPVVAGTALTYVATLTNNGPGAATDASISLPIPMGTTITSSTPSMGGTCTGTTTLVCTWTGATAAMTNRSVSVVLAVAPSTSGNILATATASSMTTDGTPGNDAATATTGVSASADIVAAMSAAPTPAIAGNNLTYTLTATNAGPSDAQTVATAFPLPAGTGFVSATASTGGTCSGTGPVNCSWAGATAPTVARTATVVVSVPPSANGSLIGNLTVSSATTDPTPLNNEATLSTPVVAQSDLSATLTGSPAPVVAGTNLTYVASATKNGPSDSQNVAISLPLPTGTSFVSATASVGGACTGTTTVLCTWAGPTSPSTVRTATVVALVAAATTGSLSATATVSSATTDPTPLNNTATATTAVIASADIAMTLTDAPDPIVAGAGNVTYTATATNLGPSNATNVSFSLPIPAGTTLVSATAAAGGTCTGTSTISCTFAGATAPTVARSATIIVSVPASQLANLSATVTSTTPTPDPVMGNNSATATTTVNTRADLSISLVAVPTGGLVGDAFTITGTIGNAGPSDAQAVQFTVVLPAAVDFQGVNATGATCSSVPPAQGGGTLTCTYAAPMVPASTRTFVLNVVGGGQTTGPVTATVTSTTIDPVPGNNTAGVNLSVFQRVPSLSLAGLLLLSLSVLLIGVVGSRRVG